MRIKEKSAISLIVLVITILVLSILAATVIISISNTNVISEASKTTFKSDMSSYKEAYEMYVASELAKNAEFDRATLNLTYQDDEFSGIFGNVSDRYKESLKVVGGKLVYESADETESEVLGQMGMKLEYIDKDTSYVGYFADIDGDGTVDGVIFADLCIGGSGYWKNEAFTYAISKVGDKKSVKNYYISQESYRVEGASGYVSQPVLTVSGTGVDRFYVMALEDAEFGEVTWYRSAEIEFGLEPITSFDFGCGSLNTHNMITAWNNETYGTQTESDMWGFVQDKVYGESEKELENVRWFVPSPAEWYAFASMLGDGLTLENYDSDFGLSRAYWSSSRASQLTAFWISFEKELHQGNYFIDFTTKFNVRLATIF